MATKLGSVVGYRSGIYNGYKVIGTQTLGLRGLVLWLKFNEGSGNIAYDSSFYNNQGTIYGATWTDGKFGKALSFDGVDDYVEISSPSGISKHTQLTLALWTYIVGPNSENIDEVLFVSHPDSAHFKLQYFYNEKKVRFVFYDGSNSAYYIQFFSLDNSWHFITVTANGSTACLYIDAKLKGCVDISSITGGTPTVLRIGAYSSTVAHTNGTIDQVRIYNRALSEEEIKMLYYNRIGAVPSKTI